MTTSEELAAEIDEMLPHVSVGDRYNVLVISLLKKALLSCPTDAGERLEILEDLNNCAHGPINHFALGLIQPMCDTGYRMVEAARELDAPDENPYPHYDADAMERPCPGRASFKMLTSAEVFGHFRRLNPSIDEALRLCFGRGVSLCTARDRTTQQYI